MQSAELAARIHQVLLGRGHTVGCAESLTGGGLAELLSATPGASGTFVGGLVTYATRLKRDLIGVTAPLVVSAECAEQMALGVRGLLGVDWAVATTGVAGPEEQDGQPVGTVYVGIAGPNGAVVRRLALAGSRAEIRAAACHGALEALADDLR